jgi:hypothetical protein
VFGKVLQAAVEGSIVCSPHANDVEPEVEGSLQPRDVITAEKQGIEASHLAPEEHVADMTRSRINRPVCNLECKEVSGYV